MCEKAPLLTRYRLALSAGRDTPSPEWAYRLYAALLDGLPPAASEAVHRGSAVSQFLAPRGGSWCWSVHLLGEDGHRLLAPCLESRRTYRLKKLGITLHVEDLERESVADVETLFALAQGLDLPRVLRFRTPTAFKSRGQYVSLPTPWLLLQSLARRWNSAFPACPIIDEDGQGLQALAEGLRFPRFRLESRGYCLKGSSIPGFVGEVAVESGLTGFHRHLAGLLLLFAPYAGVGIKTALGMGGVESGPERP